MHTLQEVSLSCRHIRLRRDVGPARSDATPAGSPATPARSDAASNVVRAAPNVVRAAPAGSDAARPLCAARRDAAPNVVRDKGPYRYSIAHNDSGSLAGYAVISVVLPARNAGRVLEVQLTALSTQSYDGDWEVIVADNGSTDDTVSVARAWSDRLPGLRVVPASGTRGPGAARNAGVKCAAGELLAFCDADDRVDAGWIAACEKALADADVVAGATDITTLAEPPEIPIRFFDARMFGFLPAGLGANLAARRAAFLQLGGFDETMHVGEDIDFCWRSQLSGLRYSEAPGALVVKRVPVATWEILRKTFVYGRSDAALYSRYRALGMPRHLERAVAMPRWLARHAHFVIRSTEERRHWAWQAGSFAGHLVGSVEHRVLYP